MFMHRVPLAEKLAQMFMLAITGSTVKGRGGGGFGRSSREMIMARIMKNMTGSGVGDERNDVYRESQQSDFALFTF